MSSISPTVGRLAPSTYSTGEGNQQKSAVIRSCMSTSTKRMEPTSQPSEKSDAQKPEQNHGEALCKKQANAALRQLKLKVEECLPLLQHKKSDWEKRMNCLVEIQEVLGNFPEKTNLSKQTVSTTLYPLQDALCEQVTELR